MVTTMLSLSFQVTMQSCCTTFREEEHVGREGEADEKHAHWQCTDSMDAAKGTMGYGNGVLDSQHDNNPFKDYTVVMPLYCSGDVFMGNTSLSGSPQRGYANNLAILSWAKTNFPSELSHFVVAGWSAGALGARIWAETLLGSFSYKKAAVLADSHIGFLPGKTVQKVMKRWGVCDTPLMPAEMRSRCQEEDVTIHDTYQAAMAKFPSVPFATIHSKYDGTQMWFAEIFGQTLGGDPHFSLTQGEYIEEVNRILESHQKYANHKAFLINSDKHCYLGEDVFWYTSPAGAWNQEAKPLLYTWVSNLLSSEPGSSGSECREVQGDSLTKCPHST